MGLLPRAVFKVSPTHTYTLPKTRLWVWLLFKKLHANFKWHRIQDPNCNNFSVTFSIFGSLGDKNTKKGINWLFSLYLSFLCCLFKKAHATIVYFIMKINTSHSKSPL